MPKSITTHNLSDEVKRKYKLSREFLIHALNSTTRRRRVIELSIRRRDRRRIIGEWALHRQDGIFGTDNGFRASKRASPSGSRSVANSKNASCSGLNLQNVDGRSQIQSTFPCHVHANAHDWRQMLIFEGYICSLGRAFTTNITRSPTRRRIAFCNF